MTRRAAKDGAAVAAMIRQGIAAATGPLLGVYVHRVTGERRDLRYVDSGQATYFAEPDNGVRPWTTEGRRDWDAWQSGAHITQTPKPLESPETNP